MLELPWVLLTLALLPPPPLPPPPLRPLLPPPPLPPPPLRLLLPPPPLAAVQVPAVGPAARRVGGPPRHREPAAPLRLHGHGHGQRRDRPRAPPPPPARDALHPDHPPPGLRGRLHHLRQGGSAAAAAAAAAARCLSPSGDQSARKPSPNVARGGSGGSSGLLAVFVVLTRRCSAWEGDPGLAPARLRDVQGHLRRHVRLLCGRHAPLRRPHILQGAQARRCPHPPHRSPHAVFLFQISDGHAPCQELCTDGVGPECSSSLAHAPPVRLSRVGTGVGRATQHAHVFEQGQAHGRQDLGGCRFFFSVVVGK